MTEPVQRTSPFVASHLNFFVILLPSNGAFSLLSSYVFPSVLALHAARCDAYSYLRDFEAIRQQSHSTIRTYPTMKQAIILLHLLVAYPVFLAHRISSVCSFTASPSPVLGQLTSNANDVQSGKNKVDSKLLYWLLAGVR